MPIQYSPRMSLEPYPVHPLTDDLLATVAKWPDKIALIDGVSERTYTFKEVLVASLQIGRLLQDEGVGLGDRVGLVAPNSPEWVIAFMGTLFAGGTVTTLNPLYTEREIGTQFEDSKPKVCFAAEATAG